jgi:hypothetical protein
MNSVVWIPKGKSEQKVLRLPTPSLLSKAMRVPHEPPLQGTGLVFYNEPTG